MSMRYEEHKIEIVLFDENEDLVRALSGAGTPGSSVWSFEPNRSDS